MCIICEGKNIEGLKVLDCSYCPLLTSIPVIAGLEVYCPDCPWLSQNQNNKVLLGLKLQSWIRKNYRYFVFQRWIKSQEGMEFLYDPKRIGGKIEISKMKKTLEGLN